MFVLLFAFARLLYYNYNKNDKQHKNPLQIDSKIDPNPLVSVFRKKTFYTNWQKRFEAGVRNFFIYLFIYLFILLFIQVVN